MRQFRGNAFSVTFFFAKIQHGRVKVFCGGPGQKHVIKCLPSPLVLVLAIVNIIQAFFEKRCQKM